MSTGAPKANRDTTSLLWFFAMAYGLMWVCFFTVAFRGPANPFLRQLLLTFGAFAPAIAAVIVSARAQGLAGVRDLLRPILEWQVGARWYLFSLVYIVVIKLAAAVVNRLATGAWPRFGTELPVVILAAILLSTPFQAGEEVGWRGYALPRLTERVGLRGASLILGVIWAFWHVPQFFVREADTYGQSFFLYALQIVALSVTMAWLWAKTRRSLLLPMFFHAAVNNAKDIVPSAVPHATNSLTWHGSIVGWTTIALLWLAAAYFLVKMPGADAGPSRGRS